MSKDLGDRGATCSIRPACTMRWSLCIATVLYCGWLADAGAPTKGKDESPDKPVATIKSGVGWATFGQVLPRGAVRRGLRLGDFPTQTDVKTRWDDGTIRFAVVTAKVDAAGVYQLKPDSNLAKFFSPSLPEASVHFRADDELWTAQLPARFLGDFWLIGPLVMEWRAVVTPTNRANVLHPFLRVLFDVRSYADGQARLDVTVENTLDQSGVTKVNYDVEIVAGDKSLFQRKSVTHWYLTRWRKIVLLDLQTADVTPDFEPAFQAQALPRYLRLPKLKAKAPTGKGFDLLECGHLNPYMPEHGGRPELAPYPDWAAAYLIHRDPIQRQYVLAHGDLAGSWPVHVREAEKGKWSGLGPGRLVSIGERPNFWLDARAEPKDRPAGDLGSRGPLIPDNAHVPSLAYVPYIITGDRYYADEMAFWANFALLWTFQHGYSNARMGSKGLLKYNETRGIAWALRNLVDATAYLPDSDPGRTYFAEKVTNNLEWADSYAETHVTPLGTYFEGQGPEHIGSDVVAMPRPMENNYLAWALDHANRQGFKRGEKLRNKLVEFQLKLFTSPDYPRKYASPYSLIIGTKQADGTTRYFTTLKEVFQATYKDPPGPPRPFAGYFGVDSRLALMIAHEQGMKGAKEAYDYLYPKIAVAIQDRNLPDLALRPGWGIAFALDLSQGGDPRKGK